MMKKKKDGGGVHKWVNTLFRPWKIGTCNFILRQVDDYHVA